MALKGYLTSLDFYSVTSGLQPTFRHILNIWHVRSADKTPGISR